MEIGIHCLLVDLEIIAQVLRIHLEVVDDASKYTAMRHQEIDMELSHFTSVGKLAANALDDSLGRRGEDVPELVAWRDRSSTAGLSRLGVEVEDYNKGEIS